MQEVSYQGSGSVPHSSTRQNICLIGKCCQISDGQVQTMTIETTQVSQLGEMYSKCDFQVENDRNDDEMITNHIGCLFRNCYAVLL